MKAHNPVPPGFISTASTVWPTQGNSCHEADRAADEQIAMLLARVKELEAAQKSD